MRIVSGGQTGVDRAALDAAERVGCDRGGWCPRGRWAEDGIVPAEYPLAETESADPGERTRRNVLDSEATLVLTAGAATGGTAYSVRVAEELGRDCLVVDLLSDSLSNPLTHERIRKWVEQTGASVLNVSGPRESEAPGVYARALEVLTRAFEGLADPG